MSRHTTTVVEKSSPSPPATAAHADAPHVSSVEERLYYTYNKLSVLAAAYATMTDPGEGGVPADTAAVFAGMEDLIYDVLRDLRAIRAALNSQDSYTPALLATAPEVH